MQLTATAVDGFTGTVGVALSGLPAGVTASPASASLTPGTPQSFTLRRATARPWGAPASSLPVPLVPHPYRQPGSYRGCFLGRECNAYHNDNARDGWNSSETVLTAQNVNVNGFGKLRELAVDGEVDGRPLYVSSLSVAVQTHNVLIIVTEHGRLMPDAIGTKVGKYRSRSRREHQRRSWLRPNHAGDWHHRHSRH